MRVVIIIFIRQRNLAYAVRAMWSAQYIDNKILENKFDKKKKKYLPVYIIIIIIHTTHAFISLSYIALSGW